MRQEAIAIAGWFHGIVEARIPLSIISRHKPAHLLFGFLSSKRRA